MKRDEEESGPETVKMHPFGHEIASKEPHRELRRGRRVTPWGTVVLARAGYLLPTNNLEAQWWPHPPNFVFL